MTSSIIVIGYLLVRAGDYLVQKGTASRCECGISGSEESRRINGGSTAPDHEYPWMVALMRGSIVHCGGSIITDKHVLTAGHCISFNVNFYDLRARIGAGNLDSPNTQRFTITKAVKHPHFSSNKYRDLNDIAVLTLDRKININRRARPICLPETNMVGQSSMIVAGWGKMRRDFQKSAQLLQETPVTVVPGAQCKETSIYKPFIDSETMICAYTPGSGVCYGDSGGPLIDRHYTSKWYQFGIVSWGTDCASPKYPGVYVRVEKYVPWIRKQTKGGVYCS